MKAKRIKQVVLVVLSVAALYIWLHNLNLLGGAGSPPDSNHDQAPIEPSVHSEAARIAFQEARVNPFVIEQKPAVPAQQAKSSGRGDKQAVPGPRPSSTYQFIGFVTRPPNSQIILRDKQGNIVVKEAKDSLNTWVIADIHASMVICENEKAKDTLFLVQ